MQELVAHAALSRKFGGDPRFVFIGGGNTSFKTDELLYIKPSGFALAGIQPEQFVTVDRCALRRVFDECVPEDPWERESMVKASVLAAVRPRGSGRPSVETPVHEAFEYAYVFHLHPALVNGMTCAQNGAAVCAELFPEALWVEFTTPGYLLSKAVASRLAEAVSTLGRQPHVVFLQNHGVFVGADSLAEIEAIYSRIMTKMAEAYRAAAVAMELDTGELDEAAVLESAPVLRTLLRRNGQRATVTAAGCFETAEGPFSPDHLIGAGAFPYLDDISAPGIRQFAASRGLLPKVTARAGRAVFCAGASLREAKETMITARDAALVRQLSAAFGGPNYLSDADREFIENWEVEAYRRKIAAGGRDAGRISGRVCVVTGAAQGFGRGIARGLAAEGGTVFLADVNLEGAQTAAQQFDNEFGPYTAVPVAVNIADEDSVRAMVREIVRECGGLDLFVANAGVLRAGSVKTLSADDWHLVTSVNYTGYFYCVKHVSPIMAAQVVGADDPWTDIVQINSKSGLEGSNRNAAYANNKFGTLGLTQSFAKELIADCIKVNSICPGNYLDGPLWSDPEAGLFAQYLKAGKVPGARTLADVRRFYEERVPMGRGCAPDDVVKAIIYVIEQQYETGQAVPVTGGQVMLK